MSNILAKIRQLSGQDYWYLIVAFFLLFFFKLIIKIYPINKLKNIYSRLIAGHDVPIPDSHMEAKATAINRVAYRFSFLGFTCLPKALTFRYWVKGIAQAKVHFGVQKNSAGQFIAHAWVDLHGKNLFGEDPTVNYKSIWQWP